MSAEVTGRRYARRARFIRIFVAQLDSSVVDVGWHTYSSLRLGPSLMPFTLYGPSIDTVLSFGRPPTMWISKLWRCDGSQTSFNWNGRSFHVKPTSCGPAVTRTRP